MAKEEGPKRRKKGRKAPSFARVTLLIGGCGERGTEAAHAVTTEAVHAVTVRRGQPVYLGRSPSQSSVVVRHKSVSRRHLRVLWPKRKLPSALAKEMQQKGLQLVVYDEDSMNGSYFDRAMIVDRGKRDEVRAFR